MGRKKTRHNLRFWPVLLLFAGVGWGLTGCIENDIPYEIVPGNITAMEIRGAEELTLDNTARTISLTLSDTVDLRRVFLRDFHITPEARMVDNVTGQEMDTLDSYYLDLTQGGKQYEIPTDKVYGFTVVTYQDYVWTLQARQNIARSFVLGGGVQIGEPKFSAVDYSVTAYVPESVSLSDIEVEELRLGPSNSTLAWVAPDGTERIVGKEVELNSIRDWNLPQHFIVRFFDIEQRWTVTVEQSSQYITEMSVNPWAKFADFSAQGLTSAGECGFQIRQAGAGEDAWRKVEGVEVNGGTFSAVAKGLVPETAYEVRGVVGDNYGDPVAFTTEGMPKVPNLGFESGYTKNTGSGLGAATEVWTVNIPGEAEFWGTGNAGTKNKNALNVNVTTQENAVVVSGNALKLESRVGATLIGDVFAAGNLFSGYFQELNGMPSTDHETQKGYVHFGQPYTGRPLALRGWYRYTSTPIDDKTKGVTIPSDLQGQPDQCQIYISLENWGSSATRPLGYKNPSFEDASVVGFGEMHSEGAVAMSSYERFEIPIRYKEGAAKPTHIVIVATSSRWGADFFGGAGSTLYIDEFELVWDPDELAGKK